MEKETLAQVFSCEFCKISTNTFSYRTPPVAASLYLINKGVISPYVKEKGGILLKFNILPPHFVTHYYSRIECQPFQSSPEAIQEVRFAQYGKIILKTLKNCFLWFNQVAVFTVIFLKPLHCNIHELWHQAFIAMKITVHSFF